MVAEDLLVDAEQAASRRLLKKKPVIGVVSDSGIPTFVTGLAEQLGFDAVLLVPPWTSKERREALLDLHAVDVVWLESDSTENARQMLLSAIVLCKLVVTLDPEVETRATAKFASRVVASLFPQEKEAANAVRELYSRVGQCPKLWLKQTEWSQKAASMLQ